MQPPWEIKNLCFGEIWLVWLGDASWLSGCLTWYLFASWPTVALWKLEMKPILKSAKVMSAAQF